jgi:small subunit ribosomal protein S2
MFYVNQRWLGGTLTNFKTLKKNIGRLKQIEQWKVDGTYEKLPKKEVIQIEREYKKLLRGLDGIREMSSLPACVFIVDTLKEETALREARKLDIPLVAIVDTNSDPEVVTYPIPANDDAIRSIKLITRIIAEAVIAGREISKPADEAAMEIAKPVEETEIEPAKEETPSLESPSPEVPEEAHFLTEEERLESLALAKIKLEEEEKEKRIGF